jgi:hypothetical protein
MMRKSLRLVYEIVSAFLTQLRMKEEWRRGQDSNLQALAGGGFQDRCITNYATPPNCAGCDDSLGRSTGSTKSIHRLHRLHREI